MARIDIKNAYEDAIADTAIVKQRSEEQIREIITANAMKTRHDINQARQKIVDTAIKASKKTASVVQKTKQEEAKAKASEKPEDLSLKPGFKANQIGDDKNVGDISVTDPGEVYGGGGAQAKAAMSGFEGGPLTTTTSGTREVAVTNAWGTHPMELRNQQTVNRPRGMTNYQQAQVGMAQQRAAAAKEKEIRAKVTEAVAYDLDPKQRQEYLDPNTSYLELSEGTRSKVRAGEKAKLEQKAFMTKLAIAQVVNKEERESLESELNKLDTISKIDDREWDNGIAAGHLQARFAELNAELGKNPSALDGVGMAKWLGTGDGVPLDPTNTRLEGNTINSTMKGFTGKQFGDLNPNTMWSGVGAPMSRMNQIPVVLDKGVVNWGGDVAPSIGPMSYDAVYGAMATAKYGEGLAEGLSEGEVVEARLKAGKQLEKWGLAKFDKESGELTPIKKGPMSVVSTTHLKGFDNYRTLVNTYGISGTSYSPRAIARERQSLSQVNPQAGVMADEDNRRRLMGVIDGQ